MSFSADVNGNRGDILGWRCGDTFGGSRVEVCLVQLCVECTLEMCVGELGFGIVVIGMSGHRQYLKINHISDIMIYISVLLQWFLQESVSGSK